MKMTSGISHGGHGDHRGNPEFLRVSAPRRFILLFFLLALAGLVHAQGPNNPNEGSRITSGSGTGTFVFSWYGHAGNTYFIQQSNDLQTWAYIPVIESGSNQVISWGFTSTAQKCFLRLKYTNISTTDPFNADFDGDGVSNWNELQQGTDPLSAILDTNSLPLDWEKFYNITYGIDSSLPAPRSDGLSYLDAFVQGLNPNDYYNGNAPTLTVVSGNGQIGTSGTFAPQPLIVLLTDSNSNPLANAPVRFTVISGGGTLQATQSGTNASALTVNANSYGRAIVYFQFPQITGTNTSVITCVPVPNIYSVSGTFTESTDNGTGSYPPSNPPSGNAAPIPVQNYAALDVRGSSATGDVSSVALDDSNNVGFGWQDATSGLFSSKTWANGALSNATNTATPISFQDFNATVQGSMSGWGVNASGRIYGNEVFVNDHDGYRTEVGYTCVNSSCNLVVAQFEKPLDKM